MSDPENKKAPLAGEGLSNNSNGKQDSKKQSKLSHVLSFFFSGGSLNKYEAERMGDHSLNSTVSTLANSHGIKFDRGREKVPTRFGKPASVTRYRLNPESKDVARRFLEARGALSDQGQ